MPKKVYFRVDANSSIGRGHISRCDAVKDMLLEHFQVYFVCLEKNRNFIDNLNLKVSVLYVENEEEIFNMLSNKDFVWLDGYDFTEDYKKKLKSTAFKLIETNDIPYEAKNVDVILNHTPGIKSSQFGNTTAELHLGLGYTLLRKSFLKYAQQKTSSDVNEGDGVFICFGGADHFNLGQKFVESLLHNDFKSTIFWISKSNNNLKGYSKHKNLFVLESLSEKEMVKYMLMSKVLIIPSSVLSFEAMALRKPFFTCYFVDNQKLIFNGLKDLGLAECFGYLDDYEDANIPFHVPFVFIYELSGR